MKYITKKFLFILILSSSYQVTSFGNPYSFEYLNLLHSLGLKSVLKYTPMLLPPPGNDDCNSPTVLNDGIAEPGTTVMATSQAGETNPNGSTPFASVWYSIIVPGNNSLTINVNASGGTPITNPIIGVFGSQCSYSPNLAGTCLSSGTYYIQVSSLSPTDDGDFEITVSIDPEVMASDATLEVCPNTVGGTMGDFTLSAADPDVLNGQTYAVTYHGLQAEADSGSNPLSDNYTSASNIVYARVDNGNGCYATSEVMLVVHPSPVVTNIAADNTIVCAGSSFELTVTHDVTSGPYMYDWSIGGETGNPLSINPADLSHSGNWVVTVTDNEGCTSTSSISITVNPNPANDDCTAATSISAPSASGDNTCATQDETNCGTSSEASVWYSYTVPADMHTVTLALSGLTSGVIRVLDGCGGSDVGNSGCGTSVTLDCPEAGDVLYVYVSSASADAGAFTIDITEVATTAANDDCAAATAVSSTDLCVWIPVSGSSDGACPEDFTVGGCGFDYTAEAVVWYTFTPPTGTTNVEFQNITGTLTVFGDCTGSNVTTGGDCLTSSGTVDATAGNTYYIAIGNSDGSGSVGFDIKYNAAPSNDLCSSPDALGAGGTASGTNSCAGADGSLNCSSDSYEASVWYSVTIPADMGGLEITITGTGSSPLMVGGAATLTEVDCSTAVGEACFTVGSVSQILCVQPGDYLLQISSSAANAGDFDISVNPIRGGEGAPSNDLCDDAQIINMSLICEAIAVSGDNTDACTELFNIGSCTFGDDPTTWHAFTVDANASTIDITNIMGGAYLGIFEDSPCGTNSPSQLAGGGCITGDTQDIPVTGGSTYYIAVGNSTGGAYSFDITQKVLPPNNTPCTAEVIGTATQNTTCCATNDVGSDCGATATESSVWFVFPATANVIGLEISFSNGSMTGQFAVEVYQGADCNSLSPIGDDFRPGCNTNSITATVTCKDFDTQNTYIRVGSNSAGCGTFSLSVNPLTQSCNAATDCSALTPVSVPTGGQACSPGCNLSLCGDGACDPDGNATYYAFEIDPTTATSAIVTINGASFSPIISIAYDCFGPFLSCFNGSVTDPFSPGPGIIYVRVEASGGNALDDDFSVCVNAFDGGAFDCYSAQFTPSRPDYPNENPNGPYCSGEVVHFCYNVDFTVSPGGTAPPNGNNCQWIQGIVPVIHDGWDLVAMPVSSQGPGGWTWLAEDVVHYNFNSPQYAPITLPDGSLGLEWGAGGLTQGGAMPAGWYYASPGSGPNCTDGSNPDTAWGLPAGCGSSQNVNFCFDLKVKEFATIDECEAASLKISMFSFADGELGCWVNLSCALSTPYVWNGQPACNSIITIEGDDKEVCSGGTVNIVGTASDPGSIITLTTTDNPNVTGETLNGTFPFGVMNIFNDLVNTSTTVQIVEYVLTAAIPGQVCASPPKTILVTVYPELDVTINPNPTYVCNPGDCVNLAASTSGGTGNNYAYEWSGPSYTNSGSTVQVCPVANSQYIVTVTDDYGCTGTESVDVEIKDPVTVELDPLDIVICKDGIPGNSEYIFATLTSNQNPYFFTWSNPSGLVGGGAPFYTPTNDRFEIFEEQSNTAAGYVTVTATDLFGCTGTAEAFVTIDAGPEPTVTYDYNCGSPTVDIIADFEIGSSSTGLDKFELYACDSGSEVYIGELYNDPSIFQDIDIATYGTCFTVKTYTGSGCVVERTVNVVTSTGTPVQFSGPTSVCTGSAATIGVSNATDYTNGFIWNTGATTSVITVNPSQITTYTVTATDANGCKLIGTKTVDIDPIPMVTYSGSTTICQGQSTTLTASSDIANSTFVWTNTSTNAQTTGAQITVSSPGTYTLVATSPDLCPSSPLTVTISVDANLQPNINELSICDNSTGTLDAGSGFDTYTWSTGETTQTISVNAAGTYTVSVTQGTCSGTDIVNVVNNTTPPLMLPSTPISVCRVNSGLGDTFVNFISQISPTGINTNVREISGSGVDLTDLNNVSFIGVPVGTYSFEFTTTGAITPCNNSVDTLLITVTACQCPQILATGPFCNAGSTPIDMNTRKGNSSLGGTFSVINPAGINMVNGIFDPRGLAPGTYTIEWFLTSTCKPTIDVVVYDKPVIDLIQDKANVCNSNATGTTTLNLGTLLGSSTSAGTWSVVSGPTAGFLAPSTIDGTGLNAGDIIVLKYETNNAQSPCTNVSELVEITIKDCNCPDITIQKLTLCNGDNQQIDLNDPSVLSITPINLTGKWSSSATGAIISGRYFNAFGIPAGPYTITFTLDAPIAGCPPSYTNDVVIIRQPKAEVKGNGTACNANTGNGSVIVNLYDLLKVGYTTGGTWIQKSGTPSLTITNGQVDFTGQVIGSQYVFNYSLPAADPCIDLSVDVIVDVVDCNCPQILIDTPSPLCNESGILDLTTLEQSGNSTGNWSLKNAQGSPVNITGNILDAATLSAGDYTLTFTLVPAPGGTCPKDKSVPIRIEQQNNAVLRDTMVCNQISSQGASSLDLRGLITSVVGSGKWLDDTKTEITNFTNVSFVGMSPQTLTYYYTLSSISPCVNREIPVQIEVMDCSCPPITLGTIPSICTNSPTFDLSPYSDSNLPGQWVSSSAQLFINSNIASLVGVPAGVYEISYVLSNPPADPCPKEKKVMITIFNPKSAGSARGAEFCVGSTDILNLYDRLDNENVGGVWSAVNGPIPGFNAATGQFSLTNVGAGDYKFAYAFTNQAPCPDDREELTIRINALPVADAGSDKNLNCSIQSAELGTTNSSVGNNIVYEWQLAGKVVGNTRLLTVNKGGTYTLSVRDTVTNCAASSDVIVLQDNDFPIFDVVVDTIACFGERGSISILNISGGTAPYQISFDGGITYGVSSLINGLGGGQYKVLVKDDKGCVNDQYPVITFTEPPLFTVDLGSDFLMYLNTDTTINIVGQYDPATVQSISWKINGIDQPSANNVGSLPISIIEDIEVLVTVINKDGCIASDVLRISLIKLKPECVPNIFTPDNGNNANNTFSINCAEVALINNFKIYDRWGNLVYFQDNFTPLDRNKFWDGKFAGKPAEQGVYVYVVDLTYTDGSTETKSGDVTLIR
ncbi:MAG: gliding motility-associated C-terminal domain-containing protein [Saprospiraceae bacterium]